MFRFYRKKKCPKSHDIQNLLKKLDYDYQVVFIDSSVENEELPDDAIFPVLVDEDNILQGRDAIMKRIQELETFRIEHNPIRHDQESIVTSTPIVAKKQNK